MEEEFPLPPSKRAHQPNKKSGFSAKPENRGPKRKLREDFVVFSFVGFTRIFPLLDIFFQEF